MVPPAHLPTLTLDTIQAILDDRLDDAIANALVWQSLGYRYDPSQGLWVAEGGTVPPAWAEKYPQAPDFIASRPATVQLTRSIPPDHKQLLKTVLGFKGYTIDQLVPRLTRRATLANWLLGQLAQEHWPYFWGSLAETGEKFMKNAGFLPRSWPSP